MSTHRIHALPFRNRMLAAIASTLLAAACANSSSSLEKEAKVDRAHAETIALAKVPGGKIAEGELEEEHGKLVWSFDISRPGTKEITEVQVDAKTGEVVSVETESEGHEEAEKSEESGKGK